MFRKKKDLSKPLNIGPILGFTEETILESNKWYSSPNQVSINKTETFNIVSGSYRDGVEGHVFH